MSPPAGSSGSRQGNRPRGRRAGRPVTSEDLEGLALDYLARFASSAANLRRVLRDKVERSARLHGTNREAGLAAIDRLVERLAAAGAVDDRRFAEGRAASLFRRGASRRAIAAKLAEKGVGGEEIAAALGSLDEMAEDPELAAAIAYARRRRFGPFRGPDSRAAHRDKDLGALGRAGFALTVARRVVDAEDADALLAEAAER
jgi:regulatory protein